MVRGTNAKGLVLLLVAIWATDAESAPTLNALDSMIEACKSEVHFKRKDAQAVNCNVITGPCNPQLSAFQKEFNKPPVNCSDASFQSSSIKSLPSTPRALLLVLIGFLWITAVKDRKFWIAGMAAILCTGQAGFARLPQMAAQISNRGVRRQCFSHHLYLYEPEIIGRLTDVFRGELLFSFKRSHLLLLTDGFCSKQRPADISRCSVLCDPAKNKHDDRNPNIISTDGLLGICCFDLFFLNCVQEARQFFFIPRDNVNSRLTRGPPGKGKCVNLLLVEG